MKEIEESGIWPVLKREAVGIYLRTPYLDPYAFAFVGTIDILQDNQPFHTHLLSILHLLLQVNVLFYS